MRWILRILGTLVVLVAVLAVVGMFLPREVAVSRSTVINAPADQIWPHVSGLKAGQAWSPWSGIDPEMKVTYEGPETGVGNKMSWVSDHPNVGSGSQEILEAIDNERIATALDFGEMGTAKAEILLAPEGGGTKVDWGFVADMGGNPFGRLMGLMMDRWVGADYEKGLGNLKDLVEGG